MMIAPSTFQPISFQERRQRFFNFIEGGVAIIPANREAIRNHDVHYKFRQDSSFYYLTGFDEPDAIAVFRNIGGKKEYFLFVRPRDQELEIWNGYRAGVEGAIKKFGADKAFSVEEFERHTADIFKGAEVLYFNLAKDRGGKIFSMLDEYRRSQGRTGCGLLTVHDVSEILGEMRIKKSDPEIERVRRACQISAKAHSEIISRVRPGLNEGQVEGLVEYVFRTEGADRVGYNSIVASGSNATVLHYVENNRVIEKGDFLLLDAGAEIDYFTGDITRTYSVGTKMSPEQREIYQLVLDVQKSCLAMAKPGATLTSIHQHAVEQLTDAMIRLKFLSGRKEDLIKSLAYKRFYPHGTGHLLGMDVHDSGLYVLRGEPRRLEAGMVFTVEPGLYVQPYDTSVPEKYRGIGVRIEDDVLITDGGSEVLTSGVVKEISEMDALAGSKNWPYLDS